MFDNPFSMVVAIVALVMITSLMKARINAKHGVLEDHKGRPMRAHGAQNAELKAEITQLKERIAVLERVITDQHASTALDREIEKLR